MQIIERSDAPLKRKENALALAVQIVPRTNIDWTDKVINSLENNMLDRRFAVAPMMECTESLDIPTETDFS